MRHPSCFHLDRGIDPQRGLILRALLESAQPEIVSLMRGVRPLLAEFDRAGPFTTSSVTM